MTSAAALNPEPMHSPATLHALTVDLEDWFHPLLIREHADSSLSLAREPTELLVGMLAAHGIKATFFVVGEVAERHPDLVVRIAQSGHEIGSHTHRHVALGDLTPSDLDAELARAERAIEDACGVRPRLFRGPSFGLRPESRWIGKVLADRGYRVDSSLLPSRFAMAGWAVAPRAPFELAPGLWEIPASTSPGLRMPYGGSVYLRVWPRRLIRHWVRVNARRGLPSMFYVHPWELLSALPPTPGSAAGRWITLWGQPRFASTLRWLLDAFPLSSLSDSFRDLIA